MSSLSRLYSARNGVKAPKGSKWKVAQVVAENAADPNYKVTDKLIPYNA
jgi:hypothetical protein